MAQPSGRGGAVADHLARARTDGRGNGRERTRSAGCRRGAIATASRAIGGARSGVGRVACPPGRPGGGGKKGALNQPDAHAAEPTRGMLASSVVSPLESSTRGGPAPAAQSTPVVEPKFPLPV